MSSNKLRALALLIVAFLIASVPAKARYILPKEAESYLLLSNNWTIREQHVQKPSEEITKETSHILGGFGPLRMGDTSLVYSVEINYKGIRRSFPVDIFLLAHHTDSNTICGGNYRIEMSRYLQDLEKVQPRPDAIIKLSAESEGGPLRLAAIWAFDESKAWNKAIQQGSRVLDLSAEKVRELGSSSKYKQALIERSDKEWRRLQARKISDGVPGPTEKKSDAAE